MIRLLLIFAVSVLSLNALAEGANYCYGDAQSAAQSNGGDVNTVAMT